MSDAVTSNHLHFRIMDGRRTLSVQALEDDGAMLAVFLNGGGVLFELTADQVRQLGQWLVSHGKTDR